MSIYSDVKQTAKQRESFVQMMARVVRPRPSVMWEEVSKPYNKSKVCMTREQKNRARKLAARRRKKK